MVKTDAQEALSIYKAFVKQNDKVVDYLNTARRLKNVLDVPVPNLKHVSLIVRISEKGRHRRQRLSEHDTLGETGPRLPGQGVGGIPARPQFRAEQARIQAKHVGS